MRSTSAAETLLLKGGGALQIRSVSPADRVRIAQLFSRLSSESRYRRFLAPKPSLSDRELAYLTDIDHVRHEALAAVDRDDDSIVGVARYVQYVERPAVADVAFEVADDWHRMGIGTALMERLVDRARLSGLDCLSATTRWDNVPSRALLRRFGFRARASEGGEVEFGLNLDLLTSLGA